MATENLEIERALQRKYSAGFVTEIESDTLPPAWTKTSCVLSRQKKPSRTG